MLLVVLRNPALPAWKSADALRFTDTKNLAKQQYYDNESQVHSLVSVAKLADLAARLSVLCEQVTILPHLHRGLGRVRDSSSCLCLARAEHHQRVRRRRHGFMGDICRPPLFCSSVAGLCEPPVIPLRPGHLHPLPPELLRFLAPGEDRLCLTVAPTRRPAPQNSNMHRCSRVLHPSSPYPASA